MARPGSVEEQVGQRRQCRIHRVARKIGDAGGAQVPIDLVTTSGSGLDPDITPASALYQVPRVAKARNLSEDQVKQLVEDHVQGRQLGVLGEARVNVLELNVALDDRYGAPPPVADPTAPDGR